MRIAVTYKDGEVFQHFGHSEQFKLYDTEGEKITGEQIVSRRISRFFTGDHHEHHHGDCGHEHCSDHGCHGN